MQIMKKVSFIGTVRYLGSILIVMQGILLALLAIFMLNSKYQNQWNKYLKTDYALDVYLKNISEDYKDNIEEFLHNEALEKNLFIARKDLALSDKAFLGYTFGIYGDVENNEVSFEFYGKKVIEKDILNKLLLSEMDESTLGIDKGSIYSVGEIP